MKLHVVSTFGDILLEQKGSDALMTTKDITLYEEKVIRNIINKFGSEDIADSDLDNRSILFKGKKLPEIQKVLTKGIKGDKPVLIAVKLKGKDTKLVDEIDKEDIDKDADVVIVERPRRGCPMLEITERKEKEASKILKIFLESKQLIDYESKGSFISKGDWSGRPYMITSRWSPLVREFGQVYDVVNKKVVCANCRDIPPSEEMLSMMLSIEHDEYRFIHTY